MSFPHVPGQELAGGFLSRSLARGQVSHAYLFWGPGGVGQQELAQGLSQALLCSQPDADGSGCGCCRSCIAVEGESHPELTVISPQGSSIGISQVRELKTRCWYRPSGAGRRVIFLREAHRLTEEAANSVLRILEEPPSFVHFILLADEVNRLPATLVSRCQVVPFRPLRLPVLEGILRQEGLAPEQERILSRLAAGSLEKARELAGSGEAARAREEAAQLLDVMSRPGGATRWEAARLLGASSRLPLVLEQLLFWWRDALLCRLQAGEHLWVNSDQKQQVLYLSEENDLESLLLGLESIQDAGRWLEENANSKLVGDVLAARLAPSLMAEVRSGGETGGTSGGSTVSHRR